MVPTLTPGQLAFYGILAGILAAVIGASGAFVAAVVNGYFQRGIQRETARRAYRLEGIRPITELLAVQHAELSRLLTQWRDGEDLNPTALVRAQNELDVIGRIPTGEITGATALIGSFFRHSNHVQQALETLQKTDISVSERSDIYETLSTAMMRSMMAARTEIDHFLFGPVHGPSKRLRTSLRARWHRIMHRIWLLRHKRTVPPSLSGIPERPD